MKELYMQNNVMNGLFNTSYLLGQQQQPQLKAPPSQMDYYNSQMVDPVAAGMRFADQGRANMATANAMMANAGTGLGIGIGRLLGGRTAEEAAYAEQQAQQQSKAQLFQKIAQESQIHGDPAGSMLALSGRLAELGYTEEAIRAQKAGLEFQTGGDAVIARQNAKKAKEQAEAEDAAITESMEGVGDMSAMTEDQMEVIRINAIQDPKAKAKALFEYNQQAKAKQQDNKINEAALKALTRGGVDAALAKQLLESDPSMGRKVLAKAVEGSYMTPKQAQAARAKQQGGATTKEDAKQLQEVRGELQSHDATLVNIQAAKDIFAKGQATGSGAGALVDGIYRFTGNTNEGMKAARELKVISGRLALSVPRFSGPQSDKDVALYRETVADVGNEQLTLEERQAALLQAEALVLKAQEQAQGRLVKSGDLRPTPANAARVSGGSNASAAPAPSGGRLNLNNYMTK